MRMFTEILSSLSLWTVLIKLFALWQLTFTVMRRKREHGDIVKCDWGVGLYGAFFIVRVKRTWITCTILLSSCSRKVAGLHSVECVILSARETFSSLSPASILSSEQDAWTYRPVTRILFGGVLTRPKRTQLRKCIFYCLIRLFRKVAIHEKL